MTGERIAGNCDTCNARLTMGDLVYTYFTPSTATLEEVQTTGDGFWAQDPEWGLCGECHGIVQEHARGDIDEQMMVLTLVERSLAHQGLVVLGDPKLAEEMKKEQMEFVIGVIKGFVENKIPEFREEVNGGVPRDR